MAEAKIQFEQLSEELKLVQSAIDPKIAGMSLKDYMDAQAEKEGLAGFGGENPWGAEPRVGCCVVS